MIETQAAFARRQNVTRQAVTGGSSAGSRFATMARSTWNRPKRTSGNTGAEVSASKPGRRSIEPVDEFDRGALSMLDEAPVDETDGDTRQRLPSGGLLVEAGFAVVSWLRLHLCLAYTPDGAQGADVEAWFTDHAEPDWAAIASRAWR